MKKILMILPVIALALLLAAPASAWNWGSDDLSITSTNTATIKNMTESKSGTGDNVVRAKQAPSTSYIATGNAGSYALTDLKVNSNSTGVSAPCNCYDDVTIGSHNAATIMNMTKAKSDTGDNAVNGGGAPLQVSSRSHHHHKPSPAPATTSTILTGAALSQAETWMAVNSNVTSFGGN